MQLRATVLLFLVATGCFYHPTGTLPSTDTDTTSGSDTTAPTSVEPPTCGDGQLDPGEDCDDGNRADGDGCDDDCTVTPACGDGQLDPGEDCDDGNSVDDDGCRSDCTPTVIATCGDGIQGDGEACDDGNDDNSDACLDTCLLAACGDGELQVGVETCDDGPLNGTYAHCLADCSGPGPSCGDGVRSDPEECDDGNRVDDDECTDACIAPRLVFVTQALFTGGVGGLGGADAKCASAAQDAGYPANIEWVAWLSDDTTEPAARLDNAYTGYFKLTTGAVVAHGWSGLTTPPLVNAISFDEHGEMVDIPEGVWSNTATTGTKLSADHCANWTDASMQSSGRAGVAGAPNEVWTDAPVNNPVPCTAMAHLYCFQK